MLIPVTQQLRDSLQYAGIPLDRLASETGVAQETIEAFVNGGDMLLSDADKLLVVLVAELKRQSIAVMEKTIEPKQKGTT